MTCCIKKIKQLQTKQEKLLTSLLFRTIGIVSLKEAVPIFDDKMLQDY